MTQGVAHQVGEHLLDAQRIDARDDGSGRALNDEAVGLAGDLERAGNAAGESGEVGGLAVETEGLPLVETGDVQQALDEGGNVVGLLLDVPNGAVGALSVQACGVLEVAREDLREAAQAGDGGAQLVGGDGEELAEGGDASFGLGAAEALVVQVEDLEMLILQLGGGGAQLFLGGAELLEQSVGKIGIGVPEAQGVDAPLELVELGVQRAGDGDGDGDGRC